MNIQQLAQDKYRDSEISEIQRKAFIEGYNAREADINRSPKRPDPKTAYALNTQDTNSPYKK